MDRESSEVLEVDMVGSLIGRPKSISPISPNPISDQGALRVLQSDVSNLKEVSFRISTFTRLEEMCTM